MSSYNDTDERRFYLDTMVPYALLRAADPAALSLFRRIEQGVDRMMDSLTRYHLRPRDGLHLAAMERVGCFALISQDAHFDRVPQLRRYTL